MEEQQEDSTTYVQLRADAIRDAAAALGNPKHYATTNRWETERKQGKGLLGALGGTTPGGVNETVASGYAGQLINVAEYIVTGRLGEYDLMPEAMAAAVQGAGDDEVRASLSLMREARGNE